MCRENRRYFFLALLFGVLLACVAGVLQAEDTESWYLISETELRSIEQYRETSEREKRNWLLQARELKRDSAGLNSQLAQAREQNRRLEQSFSKSEADRLMQLSLKNGEIADLKKKAADKTLEAANYKGTATARIIIIIALAGSWVVFIGFKVCRFFRLIP